MFQSLFYWKSYCNTYPLSLASFANAVSILVLLEVLLQLIPFESGVVVIKQVSILVLLEVLLQLEQTYKLCLLGATEFQSLFYWKSYCNRQ